MGGSVGFTIRLSDNTEHRMCRWTNVMPDFFCNENFGSDEYSKEFIADWLVMVNDYNKHLSGEKPLPEITMVDVYASNPFLAPLEYGLVVVDHITKTILSMQGYSKPMQLDLVAIQLEDDEDVLEMYARMCASGMLKTWKWWNGKELIEDIKEITYNDVIACAERKVDKPRLTRLKVDIPGWTVIYFEENLEGFLKLKSKVLELGFVLTDEEKTIWDEWESSAYKDDDE